MSVPWFLLSAFSAKLQCSLVTLKCNIEIPSEHPSTSIFDVNTDGERGKKTKKPACIYTDWLFIFGGPDQIRTGDKGFADLCLTTWRRGRICDLSLSGEGSVVITNRYICCQGKSVVPPWHIKLGRGTFIQRCRNASRPNLIYPASCVPDRVCHQS